MPLRLDTDARQAATPDSWLMDTIEAGHCDCRPRNQLAARQTTIGCFENRASKVWGAEVIAASSQLSLGVLVC